MAEQDVVVSEASRRWLCGELPGAEYFAVARACGQELAEREVAAHLNGGSSAQPGRRWRALARATGLITSVAAPAAAGDQNSQRTGARG